MRKERKMEEEGRTNGNKVKKKEEEGKEEMD